VSNSHAKQQNRAVFMPRRMSVTPVSNQTRALLGTRIVAVSGSLGTSDGRPKRRAGVWNCRLTKFNLACVGYRYLPPVHMFLPVLS